MLASLAALPLVAVTPVPELSLGFEGGIVGKDVTYLVEGDPGALFVLIPSLNSGPTPLALVDPADPRTLAVGLDLAFLIRSGVLDGAGAGAVTYALPDLATLVGLTLHAQALDLFGVVTLVDEISAPTTFVIGAGGETHLALGPQATARRWATSTALADGRILVSGGEVPGSGAAGLASFEVFDPSTQAFTGGGGAMVVARSRHGATLLADGRVLLAGGVDAAGDVQRSAEIFDPATGTSSATGAMLKRRYLHTQTLLADGRVLVTGGVGAFLDAYPFSGGRTARDSSEIFDPASQTWAPGPSLPRPSFAHRATRLANGDVLLCGGVQLKPQFTSVTVLTPFGGGLLTSPGAGQPELAVSAEVLRFDAGTETMQAAPPMPAALAFHGAVATPQGDVLVAAGATVDFATMTVSGTSHAFLYHASQGIWEVLPSLTLNIWTREGLKCIPTFYSTDKIIYAISGGYASFRFGGPSTPSTAILSIDETFAGWTTPGSLSSPREGVSLAIFDGGLRLLVVGPVGAADLTADVHVAAH